MAEPNPNLRFQHRSEADAHAALATNKARQMTGPRFDFTFNLGHVVTFSGLLVTMAFGWANFDGRLRLVEETLRTSTATLVEQVKQNAEHRALAARVDRLERIMEARP